MASTTAAAMLKTATDPNRLGSGMELYIDAAFPASQLPMLVESEKPARARDLPAYFTPCISRTVGWIRMASTTAAAMLKTATDPNRLASGMELSIDAEPVRVGRRL